jgi:tripartite-type tricarboxylate transporter receptor subunit TctC
MNRREFIAGSATAAIWPDASPAQTWPTVDSVAALAEPAVRDKLEQGGAVIFGSTPGELASFLSLEMARWGPIIEEANIHVD